eukprot:CAMPEP_0185035000 /NCGR_PEP_ID=MMETSP1103-20130426/25629_1 /TAXON_ID=36769 /ORGANISM="Paraphysomonas bandaiensis, Strain Caron Lab Isolate" /LENGTH=276 /DNA_ID=CAMNT_0027571893 /DNA_START=120 /DNA_END=948 /DNA_ORIENTATION=-
MTELCKHPSAESEMRGPIICPKVAMSMWTCSRYASLESEVNTSIPSDGWEVELTNLANLLYKNNHKIAFVGDSISLQMREMFKCSVLSTGKYEGDFNKYVIFHRSPLLSRLPEDYTYGPSDYNLDWLMSDLWAQYAIFDNVKYIVINTGAWWGYPRLHKWNQPALKNTIQVAKLLKEHFKVGGRLWTLLTDLQMIYNMTIIWRDTAPAGICDLRKMKFKSTKYHYHEGLSMLNEVGRQFISDLGGLVIPNIGKARFTDGGNMSVIMTGCIGVYISP